MASALGGQQEGVPCWQGRSLPLRRAMRPGVFPTRSELVGLRVPSPTPGTPGQWASSQQRAPESPVVLDYVSPHLRHRRCWLSASGMSFPCLFFMLQVILI